MRNVTRNGEGEIPVFSNPLGQPAAEAMNDASSDVKLPIARVTVGWLLVTIAIQLVFGYLFFG